MSYSYKRSYRGSRGGGGGFSPRVGGGGYRGSRGDSGGSWVSGGGRGRGGTIFASSSRGGGRFGGSWEKEGSSSYESRSRYSGGGDYGGSSERYSSRGGRSAEEISYGGSGGSSSRRYSRQASPMYGSREHNHRGSPDPPRKRMKTESSFQGSSLRHSHEDSFGGGNDYANRSYGSYGSSEDKGGAGGFGERSRVYREDRERSRSNEYQFRKVMGPPSGPPRSRSSPRGSFRGGGRSLRGSGSSLGFRGRGYKRLWNDKFPKSMFLMKRFDPVVARKRDYLRRLKLYKLKRLADRIDRLRRPKDGGDKEDKKRSAKESKMNGDDIGDDEIDDEEEVEVEEEVETSVEEEEEEEEEEEGEDREEEDGEVEEDKEAEENGKKEEEELEEGETNEEEPATKKKAKKKIVRKKVKKIVKKKIKKEKPTTKKRSKENNDNEDSKEGVHITIKQDSESRAVNEEGRKNYLGRPYIRLDCRHCSIRCVTFKEYSLHLHTSKHQASMRRLSLRLRQQLARMRIEQRREQLILDEEHKDNPNLRTFFCSTCKLNHRSLKGQHMASIRHRKMREFLMPYCRICHLTFRSPMAYENHLCELDHIKRAAKMEHFLAKRKGAEKEDSGRNVDMDNFMILDSVGSPDESEESGKEEGEKEKTEEDKEAKVDESKEKKKKKKSEIKLGLEYCKKVEVMYCDLCNIYLPRNQSQDKVVAQHCRTRVHLERLVRVNKYKWKTRHGHAKSKDDKMDEKSIKQEGGSKDGDKSAGSEMDNSTSSLSKKKDKEATSEIEDGDIDEKLWSEVDKDLGDLLREVGPEAKSSDEDDDHEEQGRYDRFKLSEKEIKKKVDDDEEDDEKQTTGKKSKPSKVAKEEEEEEAEEEEDEEEEEEEEEEESKGKSET